jgi:hypothetical protein
LAGRVRHPGLTLVSFTAAPPEADGEEEGRSGWAGDDDVPAGGREAVVLCRAALLLAALDVVDQCIDDVRVVGFGGDGLPEGDGADGSFVHEWFPRRHRDACDEGFFRKALVSAVRVAGDLAGPRAGPVACTAEEIIRHAAGVMAGERCEAASLGWPWLDPDELLLEDTDFEYLYGTGMDGLEDDPATQAGLSVEVPPVSDWFSPFNTAVSCIPTPRPRQPGLRSMT